MLPFANPRTSCTYVRPGQSLRSYALRATRGTHYNFTVLLATMYVRGTQKHVSTMYTLRASGGIKGDCPLDALFFGEIIFPKMQSSVAVAFLRGDAAQ